MLGVTKILKRTLWVVALVVVAWGVYFVGTVYLENDEVLDCQLKQWWAGGKKPPEMDFSSNISFQTDQNNVVADFRSLDKHWSKICLTSFYQPGSPYLYPHENLAGQSRRTIGCWRGDDPAHLTLMLLNRQTGEGEDYRIPVPADLQDRRRAPILEANYRIPRLPDGVSQCSEVSAAVATCKRDATASRDYCLLVFHR